MTRANILAYCLGKPGAWLDEPWEGDQVVKVADKIFAFLGGEQGDSVGLKCGRDADSAAELRARYPDDVAVSAYIGRYGWNTLKLAGSIPSDELIEAVDASYEQIVNGLPRSKRP